MRATMRVHNEVGLHARPAAMFVRVAGRYASAITVRNLTRDGEPQNAKSILGVLAADVERGHEIEVTAEGDDEGEALRGLSRLVSANFDEEPSGGHD